MLMVPVGLYRGLAPVVGDFSPDLVRLMAWSETIGHSLLAWGFVLAVVQASFFAGSALKRLMGRIAGNPDAAGLRAIVADASTTRRSNWRSGSTAATTSSTRAASRSPAPARDGRATTPVARQGDNVAAIWHDQALDTDPELMRAASQATLLALENGVAVLGGTLTIDSAPGRGMQLRGRIPLDARAGARSPGNLSGSSPWRG